MIFIKLFLVFTKIGIFNFGGGYAMLSLIQHEVVEANQRLSSSEFTDIVAISQSTPGPIGINAATYAGYTAVVNEGYSPLMGALGALVASVAVLWLPFLVMIIISHYLLKHKDSKAVNDLFAPLRPAIVGMIAAAAILLMTEENFGSLSESPFLFVCSLVIFLFTLVGVRLYKIHPILLMLLCGLAGLAIY